MATSDLMPLAFFRAFSNLINLIVFHFSIKMSITNFKSSVQGQHRPIRGQPIKITSSTNKSTTSNFFVLVFSNAVTASTYFNFS